MSGEVLEEKIKFDAAYKAKLALVKPIKIKSEIIKFTPACFDFMQEKDRPVFFLKPLDGFSMLQVKMSESNGSRYMVLLSSGLKGWKNYQGIGNVNVEDGEIIQSENLLSLRWQVILDLGNEIYRLSTLSEDEKLGFVA